MLQDSFGRQISDLRISVTDRCNFKCFYCKSAQALGYAERHRILTYEELERLVRVFADLGIRKVRVTGGEPMVRKQLEDLIGRLATIPGVEDLALTTNGFNLYAKARLLRESGLNRVTISLDSLQPERFRQITGSNDFEKVLQSIDAAQAEGLEPVKINCVVVRDVNDDEVVDFAELARVRDVTVRFIEFMPLDEDEKWDKTRVVTGAEILNRIQEKYVLVPKASANPSETARNFDFREGRGKIGLIMPVSRPFCGECSRIRLTADGKLRTCLFSLIEYDIKGLLRNGAGDEELRDFIMATVQKKEAGHRINQPDFVAPSRSMSYIGG